MRILVIEDEQKLAKALQEGLQAEGYEVVGGLYRRRGFLSCADRTFELIVLDVMLPGRSGLEILKTLRQ